MDLNNLNKAKIANHPEAINKYASMANQLEIDTNFILGDGFFNEKIKSVAEDLSIDLIIMGSTGAGGKEEVFLGSNTERIIRSVDIPVLTIKSPIDTINFKTVVFASSFDEIEQSTFIHALDLLKLPTETTIHLVSIDTTSFFAQPTVLMVEAMKDFEKIASDYTVEKHFYADYSVDAGIRHFLEEVKPDLLIMSNKFDKPLKHFWQGNNAIRAVNHSEFPVLTIDY